MVRSFVCNKDHAFPRMFAWWSRQASDSDDCWPAGLGFRGQLSVGPDWSSKSTFSIVGPAVKRMTGQAVCPDLRKSKDSPGPVPQAELAARQAVPRKGHSPALPGRESGRPLRST